MTSLFIQEVKTSGSQAREIYAGEGKIEDWRNYVNTENPRAFEYRLTEITPHAAIDQPPFVLSFRQTEVLGSKGYKLERTKNFTLSIDSESRSLLQRILEGEK